MNCKLKFRSYIIRVLLIWAIFILFSFLLFSCDENSDSETTDTIPHETTDVTSIETSTTLDCVTSTENAETSPTTTEEISTTSPEPHVHSFGEWITVKEPDCVKQGMAERTCECGEKENMVIDVRSHSIVLDEAVPPTCEIGGLTEGSHCEDCLTIIIDQEDIPALGHNETIDIAIPPTCDKNGLTEGKHCATCLKIIVVQKIIPSTGHTPGDWVIGLPPTISVNGLKYQLCTDCNATIKEEIILATGSLGLEYKQLFPSVKVCVIKGIGSCTDSDLHIGTLVDGNRVSDISGYAFKDNSKLKSITIHGPLASLGTEAFAGCTGITEVTLMGDIDNLGSGVFSGCTSLKSFVCQKSLEILSVNSFLNCSSLTSAQLSDDLCVLGISAFEGCSSLNKISLPKTLTSIGENAFKDCTSLKEISYGGTIEQWKAINKDVSWKFNCSDITVCCIDGQIIE